MRDAIKNWTTNMEIIPAILPKDFADLSEKIEAVRGFATTVQIDICDGQFTPHATWPYKKADDNFAEILEEKQGMPGWQEVDFEIHLMCKNPEEIISEWITAGAKRIIIHPKSTEKLAECMSLMQGVVEIGFAFTLDDDIVLQSGVDFVQLMGIDEIGEQGHAFNDAVIEKVHEVRDVYPDLPISVDGGITLENAPLIHADRLVIGSAIFESENIPQTIDEFHSILGE